MENTYASRQALARRAMESRLEPNCTMMIILRTPEAIEEAVKQNLVGKELAKSLLKVLALPDETVVVIELFPGTSPPKDDWPAVIRGH